MNNSYNIKNIIPLCVAKPHEVIMEEENIGEDYIINFVNRCPLWSKKPSYRSVGAVFHGGYRLKLQYPKAFGDWIFVKSAVERVGNWAWNPKTQERIFLSYFDLYVIITEYMIHYFNYKGVMDKNKLFIDYSEYFDKEEDALLDDGCVPHGLVCGKFIVK